MKVKKIVDQITKGIKEIDGPIAVDRAYNQAEMRIGEYKIRITSADSVDWVADFTLTDESQVDDLISKIKDYFTGMNNEL